jgi:hypothetical protein
VLGVAGSVPVYTETSQGAREPWPAVEASVDARVPIVFAGAGISSGAPVPGGTSLDRIAPTVADAIGLDRPFPDVRSGTAVDGVAAGPPPELVLLVAWKWTGSRDLETAPGAWPFLDSLLEGGSGTLDGRTGSQPLDPTATLTTIGTGGLPSGHGVTGAFVRDDRGEVTPAFGDGAPIPIIASLADDLDEATDQRARVALVATDELDRGLIGVGWAYEDRDDDRVVVAEGDGAVAAARSILASERPDGVTDVLGVVLDGSVRRLDRRTAAIVQAARRAAAGSVLVVVAGTGTWERSMVATSDADVVRAVEEAVPGEASAVSATVPGGIFLDQRTLRTARVTGQVAVDALLDVTDPAGRAIMADAFQGFAVSFARYC